MIGNSVGGNDDRSISSPAGVRTEQAVPCSTRKDHIADCGLDCTLKGQVGLVTSLLLSRFRFDARFVGVFDIHF